MGSHTDGGEVLGSSLVSNAPDTRRVNHSEHLSWHAARHACVAYLRARPKSTLDMDEGSRLLRSWPRHTTRLRAGALCAAPASAALGHVD